MNPDRFFSPDSTTRSLARELYASAADLPTDFALHTLHVRGKVIEIEPYQ